MKIKVTRKDGLPIIGRKKSLTFTISRDLEQLSKASEKTFCINDINSDEWLFRTLMTKWRRTMN